MEGRQAARYVRVVRSSVEGNLRRRLCPAREGAVHGAADLVALLSSLSSLGLSASLARPEGELRRLVPDRNFGEIEVEGPLPVWREVCREPSAPGRSPF